MKNKILNAYSKLGINIENNSVLIEYLEKIDSPNKLFRQQFELFHMDFLIGLREIKELDEKSFERYIKAINDTKGKINFWGEKFEVFIHSKLIKGIPKIITNLKRGVDGIEPDLIFNFNESELGIELTTLKFKIPPRTKEIILNKITEKILEKNSKKYSNENSALIIDITNIVAYEKLLNINLNHILRDFFNGFSYLDKKMNFGMIILCNSVFKKNKGESLKHTLNPRIGFINESKIINNDLKNFLNVFFNNFRIDNDYDIMFYHSNI